MHEMGIDPESGVEREVRDGESLDRRGFIRPVPADVEPHP